MNAFDDARTIEAAGMDVLLPFLRQKAFEGRFILTSKGELALMLQACVGDLMMNTDANGTVFGVEVKIEAENRHGNFFLETWSNRDFTRRKVGWMFTQQADMLWYYFLREDELYVFSMRRLWHWAHVSPSRKTPGGAGRMYDFPERTQGKRAQLNVTAGRCVPIQVLTDEVGCNVYWPQRSGAEVVCRSRQAKVAA